MLLAIFGAFAVVPAQAQDYDVVILNGRVIDPETNFDKVSHVGIKDGKIAGERIYWDQASVLAQIGLIDASRLPVTGAEASRKVLEPAQELSNRLIERVNQ